MNLLSVLEQNPQANWRELLDGVAFSKDEDESEDVDGADELASVQL